MRTIKFISGLGCCIAIGMCLLSSPRQVGIRNSCINRLIQVNAAKNEWALEHGKTNGTLVTEEDIKPYIRLDSNGNLPKLPDGSTYIIGRVGEPVRSSSGLSSQPGIQNMSGTGQP